MKLRRMVVGGSLIFGVFGCGGSSGETAPATSPSAASSAATSSPTASGPAAPSEGAGAVTSPASAPPESAATAAQSAASAAGDADKAVTKAPKQAASKAARPAGKDADAPKGAPVARPAAATSSSDGKTASAPHAYDCGEKGQKPCPLQGWMKANMASASASGDAAELGKQFDYVAAHAPPGLTNWATIAKSGAAKAKASDLDGAKAACKSCHDQYKTRYKVELRDRPF